MEKAGSEGEGKTQHADKDKAADARAGNADGEKPGPLPAGWTEVKDPTSGGVYFWNQVRHSVFVFLSVFSLFVRPFLDGRWSQGFMPSLAPDSSLIVVQYIPLYEYCIHYRSLRSLHQPGYHKLAWEPERINVCSPDIWCFDRAVSWRQL